MHNNLHPFLESTAQPTSQATSAESGTGHQSLRLQTAEVLLSTLNAISECKFNGSFIMGCPELKLNIIIWKSHLFTIDPDYGNGIQLLSSGQDCWVCSGRRGSSLRVQPAPSPSPKPIWSPGNRPSKVSDYMFVWFFRLNRGQRNIFGFVCFGVCFEVCFRVCFVVLTKGTLWGYVPGYVPR